MVKDVYYIPGPLSVGNVEYIHNGRPYMKLDSFQFISFIASMSTGIFMGIIRLFEPYFLFLFKQAFFTLYGLPYTEEQLEERQSKITDMTSAFLKSSLNIELVHIILKAISDE